MNKTKNESGSVTVEATLAVTLFIIFMLFLTTLFFMVYVQEGIAHSVVQTSDSLSVEAYSINKLQTGIDTGAKSAITDLAVKLFSTANSDKHFYTDKRWFSEDQLKEQYVKEPELSITDPKIRTIDLADTIKTRFIGFFANGDVEYAKSFLEKMGVVDGLDGLDFSESRVESGKLYITVKYKLKYLINIGDLGTIDVSQTYCSKIWT